MAALVSKDPQAGHDEAIGEPVECPDSDVRERVQVRAREAEVLGRDEGVEDRSRFVDGSDENEVPDTVNNTFVTKDASKRTRGRTRRATSESPTARSSVC